MKRGGEEGRRETVEGVREKPLRGGGVPTPASAATQDRLCDKNSPTENDDKTDGGRRRLGWGGGGGGSPIPPPISALLSSVPSSSFFFLGDIQALGAFPASLLFTTK